MAFQAYNFTHFYTGVAKPKKPEEMSTKEKLSAVFLGIKYPRAIVVDSLHIPHQIIHLKTEDGLILEAWENVAVTDSSGIAKFGTKGTVILFHGHGNCKSGIIKEAEAFYNFGYNVLMVDFRNHGNSEGDVCTIGYLESKDVKAAYDYVIAKGEKNIVFYGISLGAAAVMKSIYDYNIKPTKIILEMPFGSLYDAVKGRLRTFHLPVEPMSSLLTFWGGMEQRFWAFNHNPWDYASKINCPVLLQWGMNDLRVTEEETNHIFKNLASHRKEFIKYVHCGHESLCKKENLKWIKTVEDFLNE